MESIASLLLLLLGLVLPLVLFVGLRRRIPAPAAAAIAIFAGWACNVAWAMLAPAPRAPRGPDDFVAIAANYGWLCPAAIVGLAWLVLRLAARRRR